jgi:CheY-like chemotaxis protein
MMIMNTRRILVVDDEPSVTRNLKLNLESVGEYEVRMENRAVNVLTAARTFRPDLILLDVMMPEMDGGEVAARLHDDPLLRDTPIIYLTAIVSNEETSGHELRTGVQTFLAKPVDIGELKKSIEAHIRPRPARPNWPGSTAAGEHTSQTQSTNKKRILIVDDEPGLTRNLKINLEARAGYEVRTENNSNRAMDAAREFHPDLILLDVLMPGLDGWDVSAGIHSDPELKHTPIVFLTALTTNKETGGHAVVAGSVAFLAKPVDLGELIQCIEQQLSPTL